MRSETRWYAVTLLFSSRIGGVESLRPLCEERVVLLESSNMARVRLLVSKYARGAQHAYQNAGGDLVEWRFKRIEKIDEIEGPPHNAPWEVASRFVRRASRVPKSR